MQAKDIMTTSVISVPLEGKVEDAVRLMLDHHVSALPVLDADGNLTGLVSDGDLMRRIRETDGTAPVVVVRVAGRGKRFRPGFHQAQ